MIKSLVFILMVTFSISGIAQTAPGEKKENCDWCEGCGKVVCKNTAHSAGPKDFSRTSNPKKDKKARSSRGNKA